MSAIEEDLAPIGRRAVGPGVPCAATHRGWRVWCLGLVLSTVSQAGEAQQGWVTEGQALLVSVEFTPVSG